MSSLRVRLAGVIGNLLEHYDSALFGLLAPFIAPLFFEKKDPITALILTYMILVLGFFTRPLGSLFFGWIGDRYGRRQALFYSLLAMAIVTMSMGSLPIYREIGIAAPILLAVGRMLQSFCAAGETVGGAIFVLEHTSQSKRGWVSSLYGSSTIAGILIASGLVTFMSSEGYIQEHWRLLFWGGGMTAVLGLFLRWAAKEESEFEKTVKRSNENWFYLLGKHRAAFLSIILAAGFSYVTYSLAFTLMNGYIPLVTTLSKADVMKVNTLLLILDMILLPCFGYLANKWEKERVMMAGVVSSILGAVPLFALLDQASLPTVIGVRLAIMIFGVAFAAPYYAWAIERIPVSHRYLIISLGGALGTQLIGAPTSAICLWLYKVSGWCAAPAFYLIASGAGAAWAIYHFARRDVISSA